MLPNFFYHPRLLKYDFGPQHPLRPERLRRTTELLSSWGVEMIDPGPGELADALRLHSPEYVAAVQRAIELSPAERRQFGFGSDTPPFPGMAEAALAYLAATVRAAETVRDGAMLAFGIGGGLHHAQRGNASGFCVYNDPAIACHILRERFERVAYIDIDLHHGDGVQDLFCEDPSVLTCSIHQDGRTLYPGTGFAEDSCAQRSALNIPLLPGTTGDTWLWAFREGILPLVRTFKPDAIVLQMGTDSHYLDPLGHLENTAQEWLHAVQDVRDLSLPTVALGGGGYTLNAVPRMWTAACLTLAGIEVPERLPEPYGSAWGTPYFLDQELPSPRGQGKDYAEEVVRIVSNG
jgi:acetoin utilization protein AcuC